MKSLVIQLILALSLVFLVNSFNSKPVEDKIDLSAYQEEWCLSESKTKMPCK
jgi:hypothetical protein